MKTFIILIIIFIDIITVVAQDHFIKTINILETSSDSGGRILAEPDGYIIMCGSLFYGNAVSGVGIVKTDLAGNKLWETGIHNYPYDLHGWDFLKTPYAYIVSSYDYVAGSNWQDAFTKVSLNGDSLERAFFGDDLRNGAASLALSENNEIIAVSSFGLVSEYYAHSILLKLSPNLQILSDTTLPDIAGFSVNMPVAITILPSGEYILGITYQNEPQQIYAAIRKTDTIGNTIWERQINNLAVAQPVLHLSPLLNGNFVVSWVDLLGGVTENRGSYFVRCYNAAGDSLWQYTFVSSDYGRNIQDIAVCANGDIIGCGYTGNFDITGNVTCWMFRLSAAGQLLWMREYVYWDAYAQLMFLYALTEDPYGNIVATGYAVAPNEEGVLDEQAVLLKVNNMGCLSADCNDDIIINSVIGNTPPLHSAIPALQIYPNPANQTATLLLPAACHNKEVQVILYNIRGKEVQQLNSKGQPQVLISNDNLPAAGIYICKVFTQNGYIGTVKLLLE